MIYSLKEQLEQNLHKYIHCSPEALDALWSRVQFKKVAKKNFLLKEGQICNYRFLMVKGLVRFYYLESSGHEKIVAFGIENRWMTHLESFVEETPSKLSIQAIEDTELLLLYKPDLENLYLEFPVFERLFRILTEKLAIATHRRYALFWQMDRKNRYSHFVESLPEFAQRIPQYMIASYLEMTPEYLSSLRKSYKTSIS